MRYDSFRPGRRWLDTNGKPIQAHGFQVVYEEKAKRWYWYGENKEDTKKGGTVWTKGIRYYFTVSTEASEIRISGIKAARAFHLRSLL